MEENVKISQNCTGIKALKVALQEGLNSGIAANFDPKKHLQSLKNQRQYGFKNRILT